MVRAYDDEHGAYVCGALTPESTEVAAARVRRSQLSGEWTHLEDGTVELHRLAVVSTGAAVLHRAYRGFSPHVDRLDADLMRKREYEFRRIVRSVLDENPPARAVETLRTLFNTLDERDIRERLAAIAPRPLPPRLPYP